MCDAHNIKAMARCLYTVGNVVMGTVAIFVWFTVYTDSFETNNHEILDNIEAQHNTHSLFAGKILTKFLFFAAAV